MHGLHVGLLTRCDGRVKPFTNMQTPLKMPFLSPPAACCCSSNCSYSFSFFCCMYDLKLLADSLWNAMMTEMNVDISFKIRCSIPLLEHCAIELVLHPACTAVLAPRMLLQHCALELHIMLHDGTHALHRQQYNFIWCPCRKPCFPTYAARETPSCPRNFGLPAATQPQGPQKGPFRNLLVTAALWGGQEGSN